jgi:hypothetical protein
VRQMPNFGRPLQVIYVAAERSSAFVSGRGLRTFGRPLRIGRYRSGYLAAAGSCLPLRRPLTVSTRLMIGAPSATASTSDKSST